MRNTRAGRRPQPWTREEFLERVRAVPENGQALAETAEAVLRWVDERQPFLRVFGGRGWHDRSLIVNAGSNRGRGVLTLYGDGNGGGPKAGSSYLLYVVYVATGLRPSSSPFDIGASCA